MQLTLPLANTKVLFCLPIAKLMLQTSPAVPKKKKKTPETGTLKAIAQGPESAN